jgi:hypothetical protein
MAGEGAGAGRRRPRRGYQLVNDPSARRRRGGRHLLQLSLVDVYPQARCVGHNIAGAIHLDLSGKEFWIAEAEMLFGRARAA